MSFTFQIHENIVFNRNEEWLKKAEKNKPSLFKKKVTPKRTLKLIKEKQTDKLELVPEIVDMEQLAEKSCRKKDKIILDFGDHFVGYFQIDIHSVGSHMDAPLHLNIKFAETVSELLTDRTSYDGWLSSSWIAEEQYHLDLLPVTLELPRRYSFRYIEITVLDTSPKWQVAFSNPILTAESAVEKEAIEPIKTTNPRLKKIDEISIKTLAECMQDVFEDGPKRDRRLWIGDLRLQALANYYTFNHIPLVKRCLYLFAAMTSQDGRVSANIFTNGDVAADDTFLFDYSLFFVSCLHDYDEHVDDKQTVKELYSIAKEQIDLACSHLDENYKLVLPKNWPVFIDWNETLDKDTAAYGVLLYVLKQFISLSLSIGDEKAKEYQNIYQRLSTFVQENLFDETLGIFRSGEKREANLFSQIWMALAEVLDNKGNRLLMEKSVKSFFPIKNISTPYMYHHIVEALFIVGMNEEAIHLIENYWGEMINLGADTFWEAFDPNNTQYSPYGNPLVNSYCHAWGGTPAYLLRKYQVGL
ncbi:alpha-rhamnosidase [Listeria valentina]|uniref:alpha-L-rhamnosidase-related protein n=1 Tax=Listeria valentina TaxID=2705293 RepID=UPI00142F7CD5|nr:alpha-rhamnosidase [Listeria valentina]